MKIYFKKSIITVATSCIVAHICFGAVPLAAYHSFVRGLMAARVGDFKQAITEYENVLEIDKNATQIYKDLALLYWQIGKSSGAFSYAQKLEDSQQNDLSTQLFLGNFYIITNQTSKAQKAWEKALKIDPNNETAILHLATTYSIEDEQERAIDYWKKFIMQQPESAEGYYQIGLIYEKSENIEKAKESFQKAIILQPDHPQAHISMGQIYEREKKGELATQEYEKYLEYYPNNLSVLSYLGGLYYGLKNYRAAEDTFFKAYSLNSKDYNTNFWLGVLSEEKKDWTEAIKYFEVLNKESSNILIITRLSYYYTIIKDYQKAQNCLIKLVKLKPDNAISYYLLGLVYLDQKKFSPAEKNFLTAIKLKPDMEDIYFHLGALYDQWGKFDKAVPVLEKAIKIDPKYAPALNYLGYSYAERNLKLDEAEALISRALDIEPENGSYIDSLGWIQYRQGKYQEAEKNIEKAIAKQSDSVIWEHLGDIKMTLNKIDDAWESYNKARDLNPKNKKVIIKIRRIEKLVLPHTLQRKVLKRAVGNLLQISSIKTNFNVYGQYDNVNFRVIGIFQYLKPELWRIDILGNFLAPQLVIIQNSGLKFYPEAFGSSLSEETRTLFENIEKCFNSKLIDDFDSQKVQTKVKCSCFVYQTDGKTMLIDKKTSALREYNVDNFVSIRFKHIYEEGLYIPNEIEIYFLKQKNHIRIKLHNFILNQPIESKNFTLQN